jgi:SanA protein
MGIFRLIAVSILFLIVAFSIWRIQKFKVPRVITTWFLLPLLALILILAVISNHIINKAAENKIYADVNLIPFRETALVLGADKNSAPEFFSKRIDAAFILYKAGKVKDFIVSGCVGPAHSNYDEAANMKSALVDKGVPDSLIVMDREGDHTVNSIVRCKEIFHKDKIIVVSQSYHAARAVYLASKNGVDAIGFYSGKIGSITPPKENFSRIKAVFFL